MQQRRKSSMARPAVYGRPGKRHDGGDRQGGAPAEQRGTPLAGGSGAHARPGTVLEPSNVIDMDRELEIEAGVAVRRHSPQHRKSPAPSRAAARDAPTHGSSRRAAGVTETLLDSAAGQGLTSDVSPDEEGERWVSGLEIYLTNPARSLT